MRSNKRFSFAGLQAWFRQQFQIQVGRPAYAYGVRMLLILIGPIAAGFLLKKPELSAIPTISAFSVGLVAVSGTYWRQAKAMGAAAIAVTLALLLATLVGSSFWLTITATFTVVLLLSFASLWGSAITSISVATLLMFVISLAKFSSFASVPVLLEQCLLCFMGGLWAMAISSSFWIVRPYTPAVGAVADCYAALGALAKPLSDKKGSSSAIERHPQAQDAAVKCLSAARNIWTSAWATEKAESPRGNQLLTAIEDANQMNHTLVALVELLATTSQSSFFQHIELEVEQAIAQVAIALQALSTALKQKQAVPLAALESSTEALAEQWQALIDQIQAQTIKIQAADYVEMARLGKIVTSLSDLSEQIKTSTRNATDLAFGTTTAKRLTRQKQFVSTQPETIAWLDTVKNNLTFRSMTFRHALRLAILVTLAQLLDYFLPIPRGYWVTLTVLFALKPNFGGTSQIIGQRVLGTVIGSIVGIVLVVTIHNSLVITLLILLMMFMAVSLRPLSYSLFITVLTPAIILLFEVIGMGSWQVGIHRIADTLIGGAIAFAGSYLLFPIWERRQLPAQLETTLQANLAYFQIAIAQYLQKQDPQEDPTFAASLNRLRHQAALQNANAEAAAQRLFGEPRHIRGEIEPIMTLMLYIRSLFSSTTILTEHFKRLNSESQLAYIEQLTNAIEQSLLSMASAIAGKQALQPLPPLDDYLEAICDRVNQLHVTRLSELAAQPATTTPTLQFVRTQTPVATELSRITRTVKGIHSAIHRLETVGRIQNEQRLNSR
ncbi:MAG: FUSC family protein [Phormidesmis sp.]